MRTIDLGLSGASPTGLWQSLRDGRWITRQRVVRYAALLILGWVGVGAWIVAGPGIMDPAGRPVGTDFLSFWSVSAALWDGRLAIIYHPPALAAWEQTNAGGAALDGYYAWFYPPIALFLVAPLALLPYLWSLALWLGGGLAVYLFTLWRILRSAIGVVAALAFPAVFITLSHGQNAFVTTALFGSALLLLERRPALAGGMIGVLAFKPQLGVLIPVALVAGRHWRALAAASATLAGLVLASLVVFGPATWRAFFASTEFSRAMLAFGLVPYAKQQSFFAAVRLVGGTIALASAVQAAATAAAAGAVAWVWRRRSAQELKNAVLVIASLIAAPLLLDYDLLLLALPIAWLARAGAADGGRAFERTGLALACALPLVARPLASVAAIPLTPVVLAALLALALRRVAVSVELSTNS